jgi:Pyruvate/2-oxoacid:ferredoxin oxidoreductase delta subunit
MKNIERLGMALVLAGLALLILILNIGHYSLTEQSIRASITDSSQYDAFIKTSGNMLNKDYKSKFAFSAAIKKEISNTNDAIAASGEDEGATESTTEDAKDSSAIVPTEMASDSTEEKDTASTANGMPGNAVVNADAENNSTDPIDEDLVTILVKNSVKGPLQQHTTSLLILVLGLFSAGSIIFSIGKYLSKPPGINNTNVFKKSISSKGIIGIIVGVGLIGFYCILYWYPYLLADLIKLVDPLSYKLSGYGADDGFLYGTIYSVAVLLLGIKMFLKYRYSNYQKIRTISVTFFQLSFAFIIPEILRSLKKPALDLKNIWPLDYSFFWNSNISELISNGKLGIFMLVWGLVLLIIIVPLFTYFFGKRWYCSWVCGCGGLAETAGDPFRHLSSKKLIAWKIERILIYSILIIITIVTAVTLINYFSHGKILGSATETMQEWYGFLIGSIFAGVIGTGLYPIMGSRVWCRFGCPLSAIFGIIQKYKSRFRITTNGGQCISCGNCSTYCEMGIDVRSYAQKGQNIVRASCVGCGICAEVCPRGVLKLENGSEAGRINNDPILIGNNSIEVKL